VNNEGGDGMTALELR